MHLKTLVTTTLAFSLLLAQTIRAIPPDGPEIIAIGSISGLYEDFATRTAGPLESLVPGNRLGGLGSGLTYMGGLLFLGLPDRGPNAVNYNDCLVALLTDATKTDNGLDNTTSFINRFQTLHLSLAPSAPGSMLPFTLTPMLVRTTLLSSHSPLVYGPGCGDAHGGAPALNAIDHTFYFTGRSDNFRPSHNSGDPYDARFDPEGIRVSNDRRHVYMSDEYGPYVYEFDRRTGERTRVFTLPGYFYVAVPYSNGANEIAANVAGGRIANKGMEGLAITPDGKTLVGAMQSPLAQDGGDVKGGVTRIITIDIQTGHTREWAYPLDTVTKTTISDILAINDHEFLVDERDSKGRADDPPGSLANFKKLFKIDLHQASAHDVSGVFGKANLIAKGVLTKTLFLDIVNVLTSDPLHLDKGNIPAKLEGITFGPDVIIDGHVKHTLYLANDNDFLASVPGVTEAGPAPGPLDNPNQFFVFAFDDGDLNGSIFDPQEFEDDDRDSGHHHDGHDKDDDHGHHDEDHEHHRR